MKRGLVFLLAQASPVHVLTQVAFADLGGWTKYEKPNIILGYDTLHHVKHQSRNGDYGFHVLKNCPNLSYKSTDGKRVSPRGLSLFEMNTGIYHPVLECQTCLAGFPLKG